MFRLCLKQWLVELRKKTLSNFGGWCTQLFLALTFFLPPPHIRKRGRGYISVVALMSEVGLHLYCSSFCCCNDANVLSLVTEHSGLHSGPGKPGWCRNGRKTCHGLSCWAYTVAGEGEGVGRVGHLLVWRVYWVLSSYVQGKADCALLFQDLEWEVSVCPCVSWQPCLISVLCLLPQT